MAQMTVIESATLVSSIETLTPDWAAPSHVRAFNTTRLGGVSLPPYDSLNLGLHVKDNPQAVRENRQLLMVSESIPAEPHWLNQVHGRRVLHLPEEVAPSNAQADAQPEEADAAFTDQPNEVLCVVTADCLPVVFTNGSGTKLAVAHAGWKGLANGVLEACLDKFSINEPLHAWLGPAIGPEKFEVGPEVRQAFVSADDAQHACFKPHPVNSDKLLADIYGLAHHIIQRSWAMRQKNSQAPMAVSIGGGHWCTMSDVQRFHSYRRDGARSGRMALIAWLER